MKLQSLAVVALAAFAVGSVACAANTTSDPTSTPSQTGTSEGALTIDSSGGNLKGTYTVGKDVLTFEANALPNQIFEVDLALHGLTLDATIDKLNHTSSLDGFATANGGDTQVAEQDRTFVLSFSKALNEKFGPSATGTESMLQAMASMWSETTPTVKLNRRVMGEEGRGWTSLCGYMHQYVGATHDCWSYDDWNSNSSQWAYVGMETSSTYYWTGNGWTTSTFDHHSWPYEYGDCFGRCGADCGSYVYTQDCHNHDGCVRNGHDLASLWCDDEFTDASDDFMFAPSCGWD